MLQKVKYLIFFSFIMIIRVKILIFSESYHIFFVLSSVLLIRCNLIQNSIKNISFFIKNSLHFIYT